jgi:starch-binding outer membrane protein SusE/F
MKNSFYKKICIAGAGLMLLASCNKDYAKVDFEGGTTPVLTSTVTADSIPLPLSDTTAPAVTFNWTNPNYQYSDGVSSMDVTYYLEFDTTTNFNSGADGTPLATVGLSSSLSQSYTVSQLNALLCNEMLLSTGNQHTVDVRIQSFLEPFTSTSAPVGQLNSTPLTYTVTPYAIPPVVNPVDEWTQYFTSDTLYITGSATALGWMSNAASVAGQGMTRVSQTLWTITLPLIGGEQFLLVPVAGNFNYKFATAESDPAVTGGTFAYQNTASNNFNGPTASGTYTVTFNFQTGYYTITAQ